MAARVIREGEEWAVRNGGRLVGLYRSNREAWRVADGINGEYENRQQQVSDWLFEKSAHRDAERRRQRYAIQRVYQKEGQ